MTIVVTGGAGYIGSHTCVELLNAGHDVAVVDNLSNSRRQAIRRVEEITGRRVAFHQVDLLDKPSLERVFREHEVEAVIHFAALKAVGESVEKPLEYYWNNIAGTLTLCRTMREFGVKRIVYSSSATVYAVPDTPHPLTEDSPLGPINPYGRTKWMGELILRDLQAADPEWAVAVLRYFNPVGAHPSGRIGEDPEGIPNNLMPYITQVAVGRRERLNVFGGDYPTKDGTGVRDYIHVVDLAEGHLKALDKVLTNPGYYVYNLGTGRGYSVLEVVGAFERASGRKIPYTIVGRRPGDVAVCYADPSAARDGLGWTAARGIEEMCADAWNWQRQNPNGYGDEE